ASRARACRRPSRLQRCASARVAASSAARRRASRPRASAAGAGEECGMEVSCPDSAAWPQNGRTATGNRRPAMQPRVTLITLCVDDLQRALRFYRDGLGLKTPGIVGEQFEHGAVAFFELAGGLRLALWPRASLAHDAGIAVGPRSTTEFCMAHN